MGSLSSIEIKIQDVAVTVSGFAEVATMPTCNFHALIFLGNRLLRYSEGKKMVKNIEREKELQAIRDKVCDLMLFCWKARRKLILIDEETLHKAEIEKNELQLLLDRDVIFSELLLLPCRILLGENVYLTIEELQDRYVQAALSIRSHQDLSLAKEYSYNLVAVSQS